MEWIKYIYGRFDSKIRFEIESDGWFDSRFDSNAKERFTGPYNSGVLFIHLLNHVYVTTYLSIYVTLKLLSWRFTAFSLPSQFAPRSESANRTLANSLPGTSLALLLPGLSVPGLLAPWNFRSLERNGRELSFPGTFALKSICSQEHSLPGTFVPH